MAAASVGSAFEDHLRDPVDGDDRVAVDEQDGEQAPLPAAADLLLDAVAAHPHRAQGLDAQR